MALYLPFLLATDLHQPGWALAAVAVAVLVLRPRVLLQLDWGLLLVFVLMFIDLRLIAGLAPVQHAMARLDLTDAATLYGVSIAASQVISNVPAAIALVEYSKDWRAGLWCQRWRFWPGAGLSRESDCAAPGRRPQGLVAVSRLFGAVSGGGSCCGLWLAGLVTRRGQSLTAMRQTASTSTRIWLTSSGALP